MIGGIFFYNLMLLWQKDCWALASKEKADELVSLDDNGGAIVTIRENEISMDILLMITNLVSFFNDLHLKYNDGRGTWYIVTFLGADFGKDMQIKCHIKLSNDSVILIDPETLNPDIASILQTSKEYCQECKNIEPSQLEHILSRQCLSSLQRKWWAIIAVYITRLFQSLSLWQKKDKFQNVLQRWKVIVQLM